MAGIKHFYEIMWSTLKLLLRIQTTTKPNLTVYMKWRNNSKSIEKKNLNSCNPRSKYNRSTSIQYYEYKLRTGLLCCGTDLDSRSAYIPPPTDTSRQTPPPLAPTPNCVRGCMMRTPFVIKPSISEPFCHLVAFSYRYQMPTKY